MQALEFLSPLPNIDKRGFGSCNGYLLRVLHIFLLFHKGWMASGRWRDETEDDKSRWCSRKWNRGLLSFFIYIYE
jgi:hypothetical protein